MVDLLDLSRRRGQGYRRRRRAWQVSAGAAVAVLVLLGTVAALPGLARTGSLGTGPGGGVAGSADPTPGWSSRTALPLGRPPAAAAARPASVDPTVVGADPGLLHFDLPASAVSGSVTTAQWTSIDGLERLILQAEPIASGAKAVAAPGLQIQVSREKDALDPIGGPTHQVRVGTRTGTLASDQGGGRLRWQPVDGVWAELQAAGTDAQLIHLAGAVTFDHVLRCAVPFRLTWVPAGSTLEACSMVFDDHGEATGSATVRIGAGAVTVAVGPGASVRAPTTTINGRPATVRSYPGDGGNVVLQIDVDFGDHVVELLAEGGHDEATVRHLAEGYRDVAGTDPAAWPVSPLG